MQKVGSRNSKSFAKQWQSRFSVCAKATVAYVKEYQKEIAACDVQIGKFINTSIKPESMEYTATKKPHKRINKNSLKGIDLNQLSYRFFDGVDLMEIEGVSHATQQF